MSYNLTLTGILVYEYLSWPIFTLIELVLLELTRQGFNPIY
jgi:hypothetical protein